MYFVFEENADMAAEILKEFINTETQLIQGEHELESKLMVTAEIFAHLDERIPDNMQHLNEFSGKICESIHEIQILVQSDRLRELKFVQEEKEILKQLGEDIAHKDWKAVKTDITVEKNEEQQNVRIELEDLRQMHIKFGELKKLIRRGNLIRALKSENVSQMQKEAYESKIEYYFMQIYNFINFYENVFFQLWKKEKILAKKLK